MSDNPMSFAPTRRMDPIRTTMMNNRFTAIVEEGAASLFRTAFTTYVKLAQDFQCALATPEGELFCHPEQSGVNIFVGLPIVSTLDYIGRENLAPGDVWITNDPFTTNGMVTHLMDVTMLRPIFHEGELIAVGWTFIHASDIGGAVPGSINPANTEVFQEGLRVRPMRLCRGDEVVADVRDIFLDNSRIPDDMWGDFRAMMAALKGMERRLVALCGQYGADTVTGGMRDVLDFAEEKARTVVRAIPDGTYAFSDYVELKHQEFANIEVTLTVAGDGLTVDFTGSDPQVAAAYNYTTGDRTHPYLVQALVNYILTEAPGTPRNGGILRPITTVAPRGTIVNADLPAAGGARVASSARVFDAIMACLDEALPHGVLAAGPGQIGIMALSAPHPRNGRMKVSVVNPLIGGSGARAGQDGVHAVDPRFGQIRSVPTEVIEADTVMRVRRMELLVDSQSAGKHQGGCALRIELENTGYQALVTVRGMNRLQFRPFGQRGGAPGMLAQSTLNAGQPNERVIGKIDVLNLEKGDILEVVTSAGGGYGDPLERALERIAADLTLGLVTPDRVARDYGVAFADDGTIDEAATRARRAEMAAARAPVPSPALGPEREAYDAIWPARMRARLAVAVLNEPPTIRQTLLRRVEKALTAEGAAVTETRLAAAIAQALDGLASRPRPARRLERQA